MKSVTLGPTKTMIDMHNTNSCNLAWHSKQTEKQIYTPLKNHGSVLMESVNRTMAYFCHCWSAYAGKRAQTE